MPKPWFSPLLLWSLLVVLPACQTQEPPAPGGVEPGVAAVPTAESAPPVEVVAPESIQTQSAVAQQSSGAQNAGSPPPAVEVKLPTPTQGFQTLPLREDGIHDPSGPAILLLQEPATALKEMPVDGRGQVNWVQALDKKLIQPRADRDGKESMTTFDLDLVMTDTRNMPYVRFPHSAHTQWLACENCHPAIFIPQAGANPIDMNAIFKQKYCGACHDKVAFPLLACPRCHSVVHDGSPPQWW